MTAGVFSWLSELPRLTTLFPSLETTVLPEVGGSCKRADQRALRAHSEHSCEEHQPHLAMIRFSDCSDCGAGLLIYMFPFWSEVFFSPVLESGNVGSLVHLEVEVRFITLTPQEWLLKCTSLSPSLNNSNRLCVCMVCVWCVYMCVVSVCVIYAFVCDVLCMCGMRDAYVYGVMYACMCVCVCVQCVCVWYGVRGVCAVHVCCMCVVCIHLVYVRVACVYGM